MLQTSNFISKTQSIWDSMVNLIYPQICPACKSSDIASESVFCITCLYQLNPSSSFAMRDNRFTRHFYGRVPIMHGAALFSYGKQGMVKNLIQELKYHNDYEVGVACGELIGKQILLSDWKEIDYIVPVPLHPRKKLQRGYNQAYVIAKGINNIIDKPIIPLTRRIKHSISQTKKGRHERIAALKKVFVLNEKYRNMSKDVHILIVDDVITTGSTLEAVASAILSRIGAEISMCSIGIGRY